MTRTNTGFVWTTIGFSYLFTLVIFLPLLLFTHTTKVTNNLDTDIYVTPFGQFANGTTFNIPLLFRYPQMTKPVNADIKVKPNQTLNLLYDGDGGLDAKILFRYKDNFYILNEPTNSADNFIINKTNLTNTADRKLIELSESQFSGYIWFSIKILFMLYGPVMTVLQIKKRHGRPVDSVV